MQRSAAEPATHPNIILYLSDQFRWDFIGANGHNGSTRTPNLDAMASRGKNFTHAVTNQPVCAPARSVLFTSRYATETGVWHNGLALGQTLPTLAGELRTSRLHREPDWQMASCSKQSRPTAAVPAP